VFKPYLARIHGKASLGLFVFSCGLNSTLNCFGGFQMAYQNWQRYFCHSAQLAGYYKNVPRSHLQLGNITIVDLAAHFLAIH
jgi:hypothetical protein